MDGEPEKMAATAHEVSPSLSPSPPRDPGGTVWQFAFKLMLLGGFAALVAFVADYKLKLGMVPGVILASGIFGVGAFALVKLRGAPKEMGITFGLKFFSVTAYKILNFTVSMWLIKDLGFDSEQAGGIIVGWGVFMAAATVVSGSLTDALGLRRTLFAGVTLCVLTRVVMVFAENRWVALGCGLLPLAVGEALCTPVLVAALRLYSKPSQRTVAFSLFYGLMNFGFMFGYFISDAVMGGYVPGGGWWRPGSGYGMLILASMGIDLLMIPLVWFLKPGVQMTESGFERLAGYGHEYPPGMGTAAKLGLAVRNAFSDTMGALGRLFASKGFGKLLVFLLVIGLLKIVFNVMDYVLSPFAEREIGAAAVSKVGRLNSTNSILILVLAPLAGMLTRKFSSYRMVVAGGFITALSFVFMCLPAAVFEGAAGGWLGKAVGNGYLGIVGEVHPYFVMIFLWQVVFSVGEACYSPRVYEYAASIAPPGQEASYSSLSYIPLLIGKITTGLAFSGLLDRYCPAEGPRNPGMLWTWIGLLVLAAPVGLLVFRRSIQVREEGRDDG